MAVPFATLAGDGNDPRLNSVSGADTNPLNVRPHMRLLHDPAVSFEEYHYYANQTRAEEDEDEKNDVKQTGLLQVLFPPKNGPSATRQPVLVAGDEKAGMPGERRESNFANREVRMSITDDEWTNASRAMRTATWAACFYLITTDILGPFGIAYAIGTLGWGPGMALFTVFGVMAGYSGYLLWTMFLGLDSYQFPMKNYGDIAFRLYGTVPRYLVNILQTIQLLVSVGVIVISNGQALSQVSKFKLCYAVCCLIWAVCGFFLGQVRTLQKYGWIANAAIWMNLMIIFISMGVIAHSPPNYAISVLGSVGGSVDPDSITPDANGVYPPIKHNGGLPDPNSMVGSVNGLMQGVYAYAGAQLFVEFMAEMRRPRDFIKAMWGALAFIYTTYLIYGAFVYHYQGQYTYNLAYQGVSPYGWQTAGNMLAVSSGLIAAGLYGNIGIKVLYNNLLMDLFGAPPLSTTAGKRLWMAIVPVYWSLAFIIAASIPDFFGLTGIVAAVCMMQFCYSFPPLFALGYIIKRDAIQDGEGFDPATGQVIRHDTGMKRWIRGYLGRRWYMNIWNTIFLGGALATAGLGAYDSVETLINGFKNPQINAFSCQSPLNLNAA